MSFSYLEKVGANCDTKAALFKVQEISELLKLLSISSLTSSAPGPISIYELIQSEQLLSSASIDEGSVLELSTPFLGNQSKIKAFFKLFTLFLSEVILEG